MSLVATDLFIQCGPIPVTFRGTPQDLINEAVKRMRIVSPGGSNFIFVGDTAPTSNVGPWLRGKQWWVWDPDTKQYIPLDLSASLSIPFFIGSSRPQTAIPPVWLKTTADATDVSPTAFGNPIGWYVWNGIDWTAYNSITLAGNTEARPTSPTELQQYYDVDISCLIWWERSTWRTVTGSPGDLKHVAFTTLQEALTHNPGWDLFGRAVPAYLGRGLVSATQDAGPSPADSFTPLTGVPPRAAFDTFGESIQLATSGSGGVVYPPGLALWLLVKL